ncbi:hypothetical protein DYB31_013849, partial [Aphanomyces astaci]
YVATIDGIFCLSHAHAAGFAPHAALKVIATGNGVVSSPAMADQGINTPTHFVYGSSPSRGLETVLDSWGDIRRRLPTATLHVYYGFTRAFVQFAQPSDVWRQRMELLLRQDGITYAAAGFYLYPTTYPETSCVSIMKAMAHGAIPITSKRGALAEVVGPFDLGPVEGLREGPMSTYGDCLGKHDVQVRRSGSVATGVGGRSGCRRRNEHDALSIRHESTRQACVFVGQSGESVAPRLYSRIVRVAKHKHRRR